MFLHEDAKEFKALAEFPAFVKQGLYNTCPSLLPVAYSVINRILAKFKKVRVDADVSTWLEQDFRLASLPEDFRYHTTPKDFQDIALRYLHTVDGGGVLLDPGMGKTKVVLDFIWLRKFRRSLIVCPVPLLFVWEDEIRRHRPELTYHIVRSTVWEDEVSAGVLEADVCIINYTKASMMKWSLRNAGFSYIHLDEFLIKDISTTRTQSCLELSKYIPYHSGGSGTLINNTPLDCYAPIRFLQPSLVGTNYGHFRDVYTVQRKMRDEATGNERNQIVNFRGIPEMKSILESCSIVMTKEQWLKLPPKHFHDVRVQMGPEQKRVYYELARNLTTKVNVAGEDRWVTVDNPLVTMAKLYQIANGFTYLYPDDDNDEAETISDLIASESAPKKKKKASDRTIHYFDQQPKIDALERILTEQIPERKAMIWFNMSGEVKLIEALLKRLNLSFLTIKGGDKTIGEKVRAFNSDPSIKYLVCQSKSVNYGITVMGTKKKDLEDLDIQIPPGIDTTVYTQIMYSMNFSLEVYLQQQDRIHRLGQENDCHYYRLFTNCPVELKIMKTIDDKQSLRKEMLVDVAETLLSKIDDIQ